MRDNVYSVLSVWGLAVAYRRRAEGEDDRQKAYTLEQVGPSLGQLGLRGEGEGRGSGQGGEGVGVGPTASQ